MRAYWDTSALVSLYVRDVHSARAAAEFSAQCGRILLTELQELELANAIHMRVLWRQIPPTAAATALAALTADRAANVYLPALLPAAAFASARILALEYTPRLGVRSLDLLHVAAAMELKADLFLTFDRRQHTLARGLGLGLA